MHLKPTAASQIPTWILGLGSINISCNIHNSNVIVHERLKSKVYMAL